MTDDTQTGQIEKLIPRAKVAFYLGCCTRTVKRLEQRGIFTPHHLNSRTIAIPEHEVQKFISDSRAGKVLVVA